MNSNIVEEKGWTITYIPWEDSKGKERVAGRFRITQEKDEFMKKIHQSDSGWLEEELSSICEINDYNHLLKR